MSRTCTICTNEKRAEIEAAIIAGTSLRDIAGQFSLSRNAVHRHKENCIPQSIQHSQAAQEEAQALDVVKQLKAINTVTLTILQEARKAKQNGLALQAIDRIGKQLELQAKLLGDIDDSTRIDISIHPDWLTIQKTIMLALLPYMDARTAVSEALLRLETN
jgi:gamma-glutamyl-gamma-aminobutyrate hydrolase PuuD